MEGRILVAHRNELILDVIQEMLENVGYNATLTTDGHQALAKAMSEHYHLIIVDRNLSGGLDGLGLVERLRKYGIKTPIIGTSPENAWTPEIRQNTSDVDYFLPSPFGYHELVSAAETLLDRTIAPRAPVEEILPDLDESLPLFEPEPEETDLVLPEPAPEPTPERQPARRRKTSSISTYKKWEPKPLPYNGPPRILVIDNVDADREQVVKCLTNAGYTVTAFKSGQEAFESTWLNDYELILTDLWLVGLDGFETIDAMRKSGVTSPIAVNTAYITREMVQELLKSQVCKIFIKPATPETLLTFLAQNAKVTC